MLVVKVELWSAVTGEREELSRMYIANKGDSGVPKRGNYKVAVCRKGVKTCPWYEDAPAAVREGEVLDYPRLSYSVWRLVTKALKSCFPEEK